MFTDERKMFSFSIENLPYVSYLKEALEILVFFPDGITVDNSNSSSLTNFKVAGTTFTDL